MDFSTSFSTKRMALNEETGGKYRLFLQTLTPNYGRVCRDKDASDRLGDILIAWQWARP